MHHLLLFAKYPYYGKVKTRLEPALGKADTLSFFECALLEGLQYFGRLRRETDFDSKCIWCYAPSAAGNDVQRFLEQHDLVDKWEAWPQDDGAIDLGARLSVAVQRAAGEAKLTTKSTCTLIGTDCFQLTIEHVVAGVASATEGLPLLLPASDGGYVLLCLPLPVSDRALDNIRWSCSETGSDQKNQLEQLGYKVETGETLSDVDEPHDLQIFSAKGKVAEHLINTYPKTVAFIQALQSKHAD